MKTSSCPLFSIVIGSLIGLAFNAHADTVLPATVALPHSLAGAGKLFVRLNVAVATE